jgi:predicted RecB family endonuclease
LLQHCGIERYGASVGCEFDSVAEQVGYDLAQCVTVEVKFGLRDVKEASQGYVSLGC